MSALAVVPSSVVPLPVEQPDQTYINTAEGVTLADEAAVRKQLEPFQAFMDDDKVMEICVNRPYPSPIFVESAGGVWTKYVDKRVTNKSIEALGAASAAYSKQKLSRQTPIMSTTLFDGSRMQFVLPPAAHQHCSFTMRRPSRQQRTLDDYQEQGIFENVVLSELMVDPVEEKLKGYLKSGMMKEFFMLAVQAKKTMIIGGKTGSGKTTFMKTLCQYIDLHERLITIENARELFLPHENSVHLLYSQGGQGEAAGVTSTSLLQSCMRMRPDRILLAELTGPETADFLQIALSGHPGSITSMHSTTPDKGFDRLSDMVRAGTHTNEPSREIVERVRGYVDVFVQFNVSSDNKRRISHIYMQ
jgi:type IV secretion system protein VirB11